MSEHNHVLLIDDDRNIVQAVGLRLRAAGYDVSAEHSGAEGIAAASRRRPDAIVLDVRMPGMNGLEVLDVLRSRDDTRHIPVVMLSASLVDERAALDHGARYFLEKPYDAKRLLRAIDDLTGIDHLLTAYRNS